MLVYKKYLKVHKIVGLQTSKCSTKKKTYILLKQLFKNES